MLREDPAGAVSVCCTYVRNTVGFQIIFLGDIFNKNCWRCRWTFWTSCSCTDSESVITSMGWAKHSCCTAVRSHSKLPSLNQVRSVLKASIPFLHLVSVQFHTFMQMPPFAADSPSPKQSKFKWSSANRVSDQQTCGHQRRRSPWGEDKVKTGCVTCRLIGSAQRETLSYLFFLLQENSFCVTQSE